VKGKNEGPLLVVRGWAFVFLYSLLTTLYLLICEDGLAAAGGEDVDLAEGG
jgi:hypothetical protein